MGGSREPYIEILRSPFRNKIIRLVLCKLHVDILREFIHVNPETGSLNNFSKGATKQRIGAAQSQLNKVAWRNLSEERSVLQETLGSEGESRLFVGVLQEISAVTRTLNGSVAHDLIGRGYVTPSVSTCLDPALSLDRERPIPANVLRLRSEFSAPALFPIKSGKDRADGQDFRIVARDFSGTGDHTKMADEGDVVVQQNAPNEQQPKQEQQAPKLPPLDVRPYQERDYDGVRQLIADGCNSYVFTV